LTVPLPHVRHGFGAARPYVYGPLSILDFVKDVFGAVELERHAFSETAFHVEWRVGDGVIVVEASDPPHETATRNSILVYVPDVDAAFQRALDKGASAVEAPVDKPYQERSAGVRDRFGNTWWISTYRARESSA
jgi:PhnB protein